MSSEILGGASFCCPCTFSAAARFTWFLASSAWICAEAATYESNNFSTPFAAKRATLTGAFSPSCFKSLDAAYARASICDNAPRQPSLIAFAACNCSLAATTCAWHNARTLPAGNFLGFSLVSSASSLSLVEVVFFSSASSSALLSSSSASSSAAKAGKSLATSTGSARKLDSSRA